MQWSLFLLVLTGHFSFFTCQNYVYHYISKEKTWNEAQTFCREKYSDLATVFNMNDVRRLRDSAKSQSNAWIGLLQKTGKENMKWQWSLPGVQYHEDETNWGYKQSEKENQYCGYIKKSGYWHDTKCSEIRRFICYNERNQSAKYYLSKESMTWPQAQNYCREHYTDLVSGPTQLEEIIKEIRQNSVVKIWMIGLFRNNWRWSDGSSFSFRYWDVDHVDTEPSGKKCALTMPDKKGRWKKADCSDKNSFFCYHDKVVLIKENKTWEEALYFCRKYYTDLVSITNPHQQRWVQERARNASTALVWLGLRYTCTLDLWFWVSDQLVCYDNWAPNGRFEECDMSATIDRGGNHEWYSQRKNDKFNFICVV
ncbi:macrophage mannose receptor 1-like isoform 1-T2 [Odontesthes bonariensis]|uniref:macrophage mannose receptor 1-like n=1 Tax=Odontesthes bonariensis TaxID=219752 RepID=UPI003F580926